MNGTWWNAAPGQLTSDRDWERPYNDAKSEAGLTCADCGTAWAHGFCNALGRIYCADCRQRRGFRYLFDARPFSEIEAELYETTTRIK